MAVGWVSPNNGEEVIAEHVSQSVNSSAGTPGGGQIWKLNQLDDPSNPALSVRNLNAAGTALRVYTTTNSVDTDLLVVSNDGTVILAGLQDKGGQVYNVMAYGATGDGSTDDTSAINAAITAARSVPGIVFFPPGNFSVSSINMTLTTGVTLQGCGVQATYIMPRSGSTNVIDCTGATGIGLRDFQIGLYNAAAAQTAILIACDSGHASGLDRFHLENLYVAGSYSKATVYIYGMQSSDAVNCDFYNYRSAGGTVLYLTGQNTASAASDYATIATASINTTNWTFDACEIHDFTGSGTSGYPVRLNGTGAGVGELCWIGGNISANGTGAVNASQFVYMAGSVGGVSFSGGTTMYADTGPSVTYAFLAEAGAAVTSLAVSGCQITSLSALFTGNAGSSYTQLFYRGAVAATNAIGHGLVVTVTGADIDCNGKQINISSGVIGGDLLDPGNITAGAASSYRTRSTTRGHYILNGGGTFSLTSGNTAYYGQGIGSATESSVLMVVSESLRLLNLRVFSAGSPGVGQTITCTLRVNGVDQTITGTVSGAGQTASDTSHSVRVAAGDQISLKAVSSAGAASTGFVSWSISGQG